MKISLPAVLFIFAGVLFIYSAYHKQDPRNVVLEALGSKRRVGGLWGSSVADAAAGGAKAGADYLNKVPDTGSRPKVPSGRGPIVSV